MKLVNSQSETIREAYFKIEMLNGQIEEIRNSGNNADSMNESYDEPED